MPIKKASMKSMRQTAKRTPRNLKVKGNIEYLRRFFRKAIEDKKVKEAKELAGKINRAIDKAVQNKVVKKNTGARIKSRVAAAVKKLGK